MPGTSYPRRDRPFPSLAAGRLAVAVVFTATLILTARIAPNLGGGTGQHAAPATGLTTAINVAGPVLDSSSTRTVAVPPADVPAATVTSPADAVLPGDRWTAAGINFVMQGQEWDALSLTYVDQALSKLPGSVLAALGNRSLGDISVLVNRSGRTLSGKQPYGQAANFFSTNDGRNELVLFPDQSPPTVLHELGHAYNLRHEPAGRYALVLLEPEMQSFMAATGWQVLSSTTQIQAARDQTAVDFAYNGVFTWPRLSHNDPLEDFANSFALYFSNPADLKAQSPERFAWFDANLAH